MNKQHKLTYKHDLAKQYYTTLSQFIYNNVSRKKTQAFFLNGLIHYNPYKDDATTYHFVYFTKQKPEAFLFFKCIVNFIKHDTKYLV